MEVNGAPGGGGHAPRSKRPAFLNHHSWRSQLEGEGQELGASQQGVLWSRNVCPLQSVALFFAWSCFCLESASGEREIRQQGNPEIQTPLLWGDGKEKERERLAAWGQQDDNTIGAGDLGNCRAQRLKPSMQSGESRGWEAALLSGVQAR
jgi:hypothetical protein